jgi:hypothetical protein
MRRQLNQAVFERILIGDDGVAWVELAEPCNILLSADLLVKKDAEAKFSQVRAKPSSKRYWYEGWSEGMPSWLKETAWWGAAKAQPQTVRRHLTSSNSAPDQAVLLLAWV